MTKTKLTIKKVFITLLLIVVLVAYNIYTVLYFFNIFLNLLSNLLLLFLIYEQISKKLIEFSIDKFYIKIYIGCSVNYLEINGERVEELKAFFYTQQKADWENKINEDNTLSVHISPINKVTLKINGKIVKK